MQDVFLKLLALSLTGSLFTLAVMLVRLIFRKAPRWIFCILWGVVALRLILPVSIESDVSIVPESVASGQIITNVGDRYIGNVNVYYESNAGYSNAVEAGRQPVYSHDGNYVVTERGSLEEPATVGSTVFPVLSWVWFTGMAAMLAYLAVSYLLLRRRMREATLLRDHIWQCEHVDSPFVLGFIKPRIYLPYAIMESDMANVIAHEQAHIRRKDHWWKPIGFLLLSVHWFNPVLWLAYILLCRDIEAACDERVIRHMKKDELRAYSTALLNCSVHRRRIAACPLAFGEVGVKERIKRVMNYKKPAFWVIILVVVVSIAVSVLLLTNPTTDNNLIRDIVNQKGYTVLEQQTETITLSVPVSSLPKRMFSEEGVQFKDGEIVAYQDETATIFLKSAQLSNEGANQLYFCFDFIFDLPKDGGKTIYPFEVQTNGLTDAVRVTDGSVRTDNQVFDAAVTDRGQGSFEKIWFYLSVDAMRNAEGRIEFDIQLNTLSYLKDGKEYEEVFSQGETEEKLLLLVNEIINNPDCVASSNPFTYIEARKEKYNEILTYGSKALDFFVEQLRAGENGLQGYIMAAACADITGIGDKDEGADWATAQEWLALYDKNTSGMVASSGYRSVPMVAFPKGTAMKEYLGAIHWLTIDPYREDYVPFHTAKDGVVTYGMYTAYDAETFEPLKYFMPSGLSPQTYLFQNADPEREYIVLTDFGQGVIYAFGVRFGDENSALDALKKAVPEYFGLDAANGLDVYVWQMAKNNYCFGLLPHSELPRNWISSELLNLKGIRAAEMRMILDSYGILQEDIYVIPWQNPISSYIGDYWIITEGEDTEQKQKDYVQNLRDMLFAQE